MKKIQLSILVIVLLGIFSCQSEDTLTISVVNPSAFDRKEIVEVDYSAVDPFLNGRAANNLLVREAGAEEYSVIQWLDMDQDGQAEQLLFQAELSANETKAYMLEWKEDAEQPTPELTTFSRIVPERTDDYTWENDKVAFRTYGPEAQRLVEENLPGGTLSSGIDLWLKKVDYSIIDKWYAANDKDPGYYHIDHGEGYDPYHVGTSRGTGGIGVWENGTLITSKNFVAHKTIATGPLRTVFELDYAPWSEYNIKETKRISLDLGSNFSKFEISLAGDDVPNYTIGIQTHELAGTAALSPEKGVFRYWEPMGDAFVGEGIVIDPAVVKEALVDESTQRDQSQVMIVTDSNQSTLTYYAGFAWTASGQVTSVEDWDEMLTQQAEIMAKPLVVSFK